MGFISPKQLNDDPKLWLSIPHVLHDVLSKLQERMFPGFAQRLIGAKVHCLQCENEEPFEVITISNGEPGVCTGYIGDKGNVELLRINHTSDTEVNNEAT